MSGEDWFVVIALLVALAGFACALGGFLDDDP